MAGRNLLAQPEQGRNLLPAAGDDPSALAGMKSVFEAPELAVMFGEGAGPAFKASLGGLLTGDPEALAGIIQKQFPQAKVGAGIVQLPSGTYELRSSAPARLVTDIGSFMVGGGFGGGVLKQMGKEAMRSAAVESVHQAAEEAVGGEEAEAKDVFLAGVTGAAGQGVAESLSGLARGVFGKMSPEAKAIIASGEKANVPVMTSDVLPPRTFMGKTAQQFYERIPVLGTGKKREIQQAAREGALDKLAADFGVSDEIPFMENVLQSLDDVKVERMGRASALKNSARDQLSKAGMVNRQKFFDAIDKAIANEKKFGTKANQQLIESLEAWKATPDGDFGFLDELRSRLGDEISDFYKGSNTQISSREAAYLQSMKNALTDDMTGFIKGIDDEAYDSAIRDWRASNAMFTQEYGKFKSSALKTMLDSGDFKPEVVINTLRNNKPSQTKLLMGSLDDAGKANARGAIIQDMLQRAGGSPEKFLTEVQRLDKNIKVIFDADNKKILDGYAKLLNTTKRASESAILTKSGQELYGLGVGGAIAGTATGISPVAAMALVAGGAGGRMFESGPVRNSLLKLANTPIRSTNYDKVLREAMAAITGAAQSMRQESE